MAAELLLSHVISDKTLALSTPHFSHLYNRRNNHFSEEKQSFSVGGTIMFCRDHEKARSSDILTITLCHVS